CARDVFGSGPDYW
nr:immunoglobulin heavy chain junction region [Macaca mulatta]